MATSHGNGYGTQSFAPVGSYPQGSCPGLGRGGCCPQVVVPRVVVLSPHRFGVWPAPRMQWPIIHEGLPGLHRFHK